MNIVHMTLARFIREPPAAVTEQVKKYMQNVTNVNLGSVLVNRTRLISHSTPHGQTDYIVHAHFDIGTDDNQGDAAVLSNYISEQVGGINLDPQFLDLQIRRDSAGMPLPVSEQPIYICFF